MPSILVTALALVLTLAGAGQSSQEFRLPNNPRDLASLPFRWQVKIPVGSVFLRNGVLYIRGAGGVTALDGNDGAVGSPFAAVAPVFLVQSSVAQGFRRVGGSG